MYFVKKCSAILIYGVHPHTLYFWKMGKRIKVRKTKTGRFQYGVPKELYDEYCQKHNVKLPILGSN